MNKNIIGSALAIFIVACASDRLVTPTEQSVPQIGVPTPASGKVAKPLSKKKGAEESGVVAAFISPQCIIVPQPYPLALSVDGFSPNPKALQLSVYVQCPNDLPYIAPGNSLGFVWSSTNGAIVTVSSRGVATSVNAGGAGICVVTQGLSGCTPVTVYAASVASRVSITPATFAVNNGATKQLSAEVTNQFGTIVSTPVTWSSLNTATATVSTSGLVTGVSFGEARIQACAQSDGSQVCGMATGDVNPLGVSMTGACLTCTVNSPNTVRTYSANVTGGDGTITYEWRVIRPYGGVQPFGTGQTETVNFTCFDEGDNEIEVLVRSGGVGMVTTRQTIVMISPELCTP